MRFAKAGKGAAVAATFLLALVAIPYGIMSPKDPRFHFEFLGDRRPIQIGLRQEIGGGANGFEFAFYYWKQPYKEVLSQVRRELSGWKEGRKYQDFASFSKGDESVYVMATELTTGKVTYRDKYDKTNFDFVVVEVERHLPEGLYSELRVNLFATHF